MTSSQTITNRLRVLAIANNTKAQYPGNIAQTNPLISTINCNSNFGRLFYKTNKKKCCTPSEIICRIPPSINGGNPLVNPSYLVNGSLPSSQPTCYINGGTPFTIGCN
jgi:hypothetical protein